MENISGKGRTSFRWMLPCATMGLAVSVSLCFAQGDRDTSKELQRLGTAPPEITPFKCDSLDPKVCLDIYQRKLEKSALLWGEAHFAPNLTTKIRVSTFDRNRLHHPHEPQHAYPMDCADTAG
jgi:hypothetical protein